MPFTTFRKLGKGPADLLEMDMMLKDFGGNASKTRGAVSVELTIGSKTLPTTFFVINGKETYSLLLGHDWIHVNCCIPSTIHQCLIQWQGDNVEVVSADTSVSVAIADTAYWSLKITNASLEGFGKEVSSSSMMNTNNRSKQSALRVYFSDSS
jgi:hypothetical protein